MRVLHDIRRWNGDYWIRGLFLRICRYIWTGYDANTKPQLMFCQNLSCSD